VSCSGKLNVREKINKIGEQKGVKPAKELEKSLFFAHHAICFRV